MLVLYYISRSEEQNTTVSCSNVLSLIHLISSRGPPPAQQRRWVQLNPDANVTNSCGHIHVRLHCVHILVLFFLLWHLGSGGRWSIRRGTTMCHRQRSLLVAHTMRLMLIAVMVIIIAHLPLSLGHWTAPALRLPRVVKVRRIAVHTTAQGLRPAPVLEREFRQRHVEQSVQLACVVADGEIQNGAVESMHDYGCAVKGTRGRLRTRMHAQMHVRTLTAVSTRATDARLPRASSTINGAGHANVAVGVGLARPEALRAQVRRTNDFLGEREVGGFVVRHVAITIVVIMRCSWW